MKQPTKPFALRVDNTDYDVSLILGKVYRILPDSRAAKDDLVRIVDESGEDYLYHKNHFVFVDFPKAIKEIQEKGSSLLLTQLASFISLKTTNTKPWLSNPVRAKMRNQRCDRIGRTQPKLFPRKIRQNL